MKLNLLRIFLCVFLMTSGKTILAIKTDSIDDIPFKENLIPSSCLSEEQTKQLNEIDLELKKKQIPIDAEIKVKMLELRYLIDEEKIDKEKINQKIEEIARLRKTLLEIQVEYELEINKLLTPEQKKKIKLERCPRIEKEY